MPTTALLTDHTSSHGARGAKPVRQIAVRLRVFARRLRRPPHGVVAAWPRAPGAATLRFDEESLRFLTEKQIVDRATADWLATSLSGDIWGYPEGEVYFPGSRW